MKDKKIREFKADDFRKELNKVLPGYKWTISKHTGNGQHLTATGIQSSGFNRVSTIEIYRESKDGYGFYSAKIWGYGRRSPLVAETGEFGSLKRALRLLQEYCEHRSSVFKSAANYIEFARRIGS